MQPHPDPTPNKPEHKFYPPTPIFATFLLHDFSAGEAKSYRRDVGSYLSLLAPEKLAELRDGVGECTQMFEFMVSYGALPYWDGPVEIFVERSIADSNLSDTIYTVFGYWNEDEPFEAAVVAGIHDDLSGGDFSGLQPWSLTVFAPDPQTAISSALTSIAGVSQ